MKYVVLEMFGDVHDEYRTYMPGDTYPRVGYAPTKERIEELASDKNKRQHPVIKAVDEPKAEVPKKEAPKKEEPKKEVPKEEPKEEEATPRKQRRKKG